MKPTTSVAADPLQVVPDADVEDGLEAGVRRKDAEPPGSLQDLDQVGRLGVLDQRVADPQLLRPLHVIADVGDVDAGSGDLAACP